MKQLVFILLTAIIFGCNHNYEKEDLVGIWEIVSITNLESGEMGLSEVDFDRYVVEIRLDSITEYEGDTYAWKLQGDSIFVDMMAFKIKALTANSIIVVEYDDFWSDSKQETKFKRIK